MNKLIIILGIFLAINLIVNNPLKANSNSEVIDGDSIKVNTINLHPRFKMVRGRVARTSGYKKAIVTLKKGQSIDITTGI